MRHALLHGASGLPGLSQAIVTYLLTGDLDEATKYVDFTDIPSLEVREVVKQVIVRKIASFWRKTITAM